MPNSAGVAVQTESVPTVASSPSHDEEASSSAAVASSSTTHHEGAPPPPTTSASSKPKAWYSLIAGGVAGAVSRTATAPLDRIKTLYQEGRLIKFEQSLHHPTLHVVADSHKKRVPLRKVMQHIYREGGVKGFWRGNGVNCFKAGPELALVFYLRQVFGDAMASGRQWLSRMESMDVVASERPTLHHEMMSTSGHHHEAGGDAARADSLDQLLHHSGRPPSSADPVTTGSRSDAHVTVGGSHHFLGARAVAARDAIVHRLGGSHAHDGGYYEARNTALRSARSFLYNDPYVGRHDLPSIGKPHDVGVELSARVFRSASSLLTTSSIAVQLIGDFMTSAAAGAVAQTLVYPLEIVKTRIAVSSRGEYRGVFDCFVQAYHHGGWREFYKGLSANMMGIVPFRGLEIGLFMTMQRAMLAYQLREYERGMAQSLLHDRANDGSTSGDLSDASPTPVSASGPPEKLSTATVAVVGGMSSVVAQTVTYPLNIVRTRLQTQGVNGRPKIYNGVFDCIGKVVAAEGFGGLFHGLAANYLKAVPASVITFVVVANVTQSLQNIGA